MAKFIQSANFPLVISVTRSPKSPWDDKLSVQKQQSRPIHPEAASLLVRSAMLAGGDVGWRRCWLAVLDFAANVFNDAVAQQDFDIHFLDQIVAFGQVEHADDLALVDFLFEF
jgi:hypothetical protein